MKVFEIHAVCQKNGKDIASPFWSSLQSSKATSVPCMAKHEAFDVDLETILMG